MTTTKSAPSRNLFLAGTALASVVFLVVMHVLLHVTKTEADSHKTIAVTAKFLFDKDPGVAFNPLSLQNLMWIFFFVGLAELYLRYVETRDARRHLGKGYLPEEEGVVLQPKDLAPIYQKVRGAGAEPSAYLPRIILQSVLQFQSTRAVDQANTVLTSQVELLAHQVELRYALMRFIVWFIPTLGFIGTVYGIALALMVAGDMPPETPDMLKQLSAALAVAFYTTLLALLQAAVLVYLMTVIQRSEEEALNHSQQYCLVNFINRLYVP